MKHPLPATDQYVNDSPIHQITCMYIWLQCNNLHWLKYSKIVLALLKKLDTRSPNYKESFDLS